MEADVVALWALLAAIAYGVLGGADYGGGIWDLFAAGPRARAQRVAIGEAMGPVWEANHVWLIFILVLLFSGFPSAYASISIALFVPAHLVLLGIILRGAAFIFRDHAARWWSPVFGAASTITPVLLGMCIGMLSDGSVHVTGGIITVSAMAMVGPTPLLIGAMALAICSVLAAVYLTNEVEGELREDFRQRAIWSLILLILLSGAGVPILSSYAPHLAKGLYQQLVGVVGLGFLAAAGAGFALYSHHFRSARILSAAFAAAMIAGWGLAQYPHLIYPDVDLHAAAARRALPFLVGAVPAGMVILIPSLALLFHVFKRGRGPAA